jgi:hypothetical protein
MKLSIPPNFFSDGCLANSPDSLIVDGWIECVAKLMNARGHVVDADAFRAFGRRAFGCRAVFRCVTIDSGAPSRSASIRARRVGVCAAPIRRFDNSRIRRERAVGSRSDRF